MNKTQVQNTKSDADKSNRTKLRRILVERFDETELRDLFFDLNVEYDSLPGEGTRNKARELIGYCERRERIGELIEKGKQLRPDISWPDLDSEQKISKENHLEDRRIAEDRRNQATLQVYFDRMTELLLEKGLRESQKDDAVRSIARARTLDVLQSLDGRRKGQVLQFLYEAGLITSKHCAVYLSKANLHGAKLYRADLRRTYLRRVILSNADLGRTDLTEADLSWADLIGADLRRATLIKADLHGAALMGADLSWADLTDAKVTDEQLSQAASLAGATLPDGTKAPDEAAAGERE